MYVGVYILRVNRSNMSEIITAKTREQTYKEAIEFAVDSLSWDNRFIKVNALRAFGYFVLRRTERGGE